MLSCCFEAFSVKFTENFSFQSKKWLSQKGAEEYSESFFFLTSLKRGKSWGKFGLDVNNPFCKKQENGTNINKNFFFHKMRHIELNFAFLFFWSILGEIQWKLDSFIHKMTISERSSEILRKITFLNKFEKGKSQRKVWIWCKQVFWFTVKWNNY